MEIRQLQQRLGITTLYVTHDQVEAMTMSDRIVVLNQGDIEQIGRPLEIYEKPASLFVANFIGSPAMNLIKVKTDGGNVVLPSGSPIAAGRALPLGEITLGIRPERIKLSGNKSAQSLPYRITLVEELGSQKIVHGNIEGTDLTVVFPEDIALPGDEAFVDLPLNYLHFFDAQSGKRV